MKGKDILVGLGYIGDDLIEKSEYGDMPVRGESFEKQEKGRRLSHRQFLVAAIIAMMLLLVGCTVAYLLSIQGIKLGDQTGVQDIYEYDPSTGEAVSYKGQESYTQQVLTLAGLNGTPASQAAREWYEFCESYDPNREIQKSVWGNYPEFPAEYYGYGLYTQEMKDKLDEILAKYDLKLRGDRVEFQTGKLLLRALGMETILRADSTSRLMIKHYAYYTNGNLDLDFEMTHPEKDGESVRGYLYYRPKNCLIPDTAVLTEATWEEWNYTTSSGAKVMIVRSEEASSAWIFSDMADHTASVRFDAVRRMYEETEDGTPVAKFAVLSKAQLEQIADAIDFSLEPKLIDGWETLPDNAVPAGQEINGYSITPVSAFTDGYGYKIVLRIDAPEGVNLTDPDDHTARVEAGGGVYGYCKEDGDGKRNTCHVILSESIPKSECPEDGTYPYPEGNMIPVYWEDLYFTRYDFEKNQSVATLLTEGTWKFNIPLSTSDTREIELLTQPISAKCCIGWSMDGTDALEERKIISIKLRPLSIDLTAESKDYGADFFCFTGHCSYIVMKDGSWVEFTSYALDDPIDLDQVAYVQLADKTIIPMPGVDEQTVKLISEMVQAQWDAAFVPAPVFEDGIELLQQPITMKSLGGYVTDDTGVREPLYEYLPITSIILHPEGLAIMGPAAFDTSDNQATVFCKDGSKILLTGMGEGPYCDEPMSQLKAEKTIDLLKAERILLPDGTELEIPSIT